HPYVNFPAHTDDNWEECKQNMLKHNMDNIIEFYTSHGKYTYGIPSDYQDIVDAIKQRDNLSLVMNMDRLGEALNVTFPPVDILKSIEYKPKIVTLPSTVHLKLTAYELERGDSQLPGQLEHVTKTIYSEIQRGNMPLDSPIYYEPLPPSR